MENVGGEVLRLIAIVNPSRDECIHAFEIVFVKLGEAGRVALCGLDQTALGRRLPFILARPLEVLRPATLQCGFSSHLRL